MRFPPHALFVLIFGASGFAPVFAAENGQASGKAAYTLFDPVPDDRLRDMVTDRPDTTESPVTVDAGHFQVEASFFDFNRDRSGGVSTETWSWGQMNLKAGLLDRTDIQFVFDSYVRTKTSGAGATSTVSGVSDLTVRLKQNLWGDEGDTRTAFALMPWISAPTGSDGVSADQWQGGLILPVSAKIADGLDLGAMLESDVLWDGAKYYVEWTHSITCGIGLTDDVGMYVEYVGVHDSGSASNYRAYGDAGVTFAARKNLVFDAGVRVGLNAAPTTSASSPASPIATEP